MTDQKMIAAIFNDFMSLYRGTSQIGIQEICKKYENHRMLMGLLANLDEAAAIPVPQVMKECYGIYKQYREREMEEKDWEAVVEETRVLAEKWKSNKWCVRVLIELMGLLEHDYKERRRIAKEVEKEMEEAMQNDKAA